MARVNNDLIGPLLGAKGAYLRKPAFFSPDKFSEGEMLLSSTGQNHLCTRAQISGTGRKKTLVRSTSIRCEAAGLSGNWFIEQPSFNTGFRHLMLHGRLSFTQPGDTAGGNSHEGQRGNMAFPVTLRAPHGKSVVVHPPPGEGLSAT